MNMTDNLDAVCGSWRLGREIGHGAYGVVYLAVGLNGKFLRVYTRVFI